MIRSPSGPEQSPIDPPALAIFRPVYAPQIGSPIDVLCRQLTSWAADYEGIDTFSTEGGEALVLRQDIVTEGEIKSSLSFDGTMVADPALHKDIRNNVSLAEEPMPAAVLGMDLKTDRQTGHHYINLRVIDPAGADLQRQRLATCIILQNRLSKRKVDRKPLISPVMPLRSARRLDINLVRMHKDALSGEKAETMAKAVRACRQMDVILGSIVFPESR